MAKTKTTEAFTPAPGARFQTNEKFRRATGGMAFRGRLVKPHPPITGCWVCEFDGIGGASQYVHAGYMEREVANG